MSEPKEGARAGLSTYYGSVTIFPDGTRISHTDQEEPPAPISKGGYVGQRTLTSAPSPEKR